MTLIEAVQMFKQATFNAIQDEDRGKKSAPYQFFPCSFYKCRNYPQKLSDF